MTKMTKTVSWKNRPDNRIGDCLETRKILHEMNLTEEQLEQTLIYFFPDLYGSDEVQRKHVVRNIIEDHTSYPPDTDWILKDVAIINYHLKKQGII